jgi:hypothetical protein
MQKILLKRVNKYILSLIESNKGRGGGELTILG